MKFIHAKRRSKSEVYDKRLIQWLIIRRFIPENKDTVILDLASGTGGFYFALKQLGYKNVMAVDNCPQFKECINEDLFNFLNKHHKYFELIISRDILEHTNTPEVFFDSQYNALKKNGKLIVMTPNAERISMGKFYSVYTHVRPYTRSSLKMALEMHGFKDIKIKRLRDFEWRLEDH